MALAIGVLPLLSTPMPPDRSRWFGWAPRISGDRWSFWFSKSLGVASVSLAGLIDLCIAENERRLAGYDPRLLRPNVVPRLMRLVRRLLPTPKAAPA